jgi:putative transposase
MSRGNAKQPIFVETEDYEQFLDLLSAALLRFHVLCRAYCLLPNHFHLLVEPAASPLSRMMQQLNSTYSQWFNRRHNRVGHLLQGRFKALLVDRNEYFLRVVRYIVLNPVKQDL